MMPQYSYIAVGHKYFLARCNCVSLAWTLLTRHKSHLLDSLGLRRWRIPGILKVILRNCCNRAGPGTANTITLPAYGQLCIRVHQGYKIFDFPGRVTTKVFEQNIDAEIAANEINAVRGASSLSFTPTLIEADPDNGWYSETFIPGKRSAKTSRSVPGSMFKQVIAGHICEMLVSRPMNTIGLSEYAGKTRDAVDQLLAHTQPDREFSTHVHDFVCRIISNLEAAEEIPVQLAFTHGDFSFVNFIYISKTEINVIDWESAKFRSILSDLYNYFLTELYYGRTRNNLVTEINEAISLLTERLAATDMSTQFDTLEEFGAIYRWLYYIERIQVLLDREPSDIQQNVIRRSIETFMEYEALCPVTMHNPPPTTQV